MVRLIVIDESLNRRLATELGRRGRRATSVGALGLRGVEDTPLLDALTQREPDSVLVTGDIDMPRDHPDALRRSRVSLCITEPRPKESTLSEDEWRSELVHRWIHRMVDQAPATVCVYGLRGRRPWRPRQQRPRRP